VVAFWFRSGLKRSARAILAADAPGSAPFRRGFSFRARRASMSAVPRSPRDAPRRDGLHRPTERAVRRTFTPHLAIREGGVFFMRYSVSRRELIPGAVSRHSRIPDSNPIARSHSLGLRAYSVLRGIRSRSSNRLRSDSHQGGADCRCPPGSSSPAGPSQCHPGRTPKKSLTHPWKTLRVTICSTPNSLSYIGEERKRS
jgi:hypothetical protein